jgi:hypothetical protein
MNKYDNEQEAQFLRSKIVGQRISITQYDDETIIAFGNYSVALQGQRGAEFAPMHDRIVNRARIVREGISIETEDNRLTLGKPVVWLEKKSE